MIRIDQYSKLNMATGFCDTYGRNRMTYNGTGFEMIDKSNESLAKKFCFGRQIVDNNFTDVFGVNTFVGILHLSSKKVHTTAKHGIILREFTPFVKCLPKILVKTKKTTEYNDLYAVVKIERYDEYFETLICCVLEYITYPVNYKDDLSILENIATSHWTKRHDKIAKMLANGSNISDLTPDRTDLTHLEVYSVDPPGCDDIDDAIHCIKTQCGYQIGIHIADVTSYIPKNDTYDIELSKRGQTIYFDNESMNKINMIHESLSIDVMSLKEKQIKRCFSVIIELDEVFNITKVNFMKTLVNVTSNLSYDECDAIIKKKSNQSLGLMYDIGRKINTFCDDSEYDVHNMIATYMIYANKLVAEKIAKYDPTKVILRSQDSKKMSTKKIVDMDNDDKSSEINDLIRKHNALLSERAYYQIGTNKCQHMELGLEHYTHFTSPIRRYIDMCVHRQLYNVLTNQSLSTIDIKTLFTINTYGKIYRQIQRYSHLLEIAWKLTDCIETTAVIVLMRSENNSIKLYIPEFNLYCDMYLFDKKMRHIIIKEISDKNDSCNDIIVLNNESIGKSLTLKLFDSVKVKLSISGGIDKLNVALVDNIFL